MDEASQFSDLEDQVGISPAHRPVHDKEMLISSKMEEKISTISEAKIGENIKEEVLQVVKTETESILKDTEKVSIIFYTIIL